MRKRLMVDFPGALAVFLVALPLSLGLAQICGVPATSGLVAGLVGGVLVGLLSGSQLSVSGPASSLVPVVLLGIAKLGVNATLCAVMVAGVLQILLGALRAGSLSRLFPAAVVRGMMAGIGLVMVTKQIPHVLGYDREAFGLEQMSALGRMANLPLETVPCLLGIFSLLLMIYWELKVHPRWPMLPGSIVVAAAGVTINQILKLTAPQWALSAEHRVQIPLNWLSVHPRPDWSSLNNPELYWVALSLALLSSLEALVALEVIDRLDPEHRVAPPNRELVAQGLGNVVSGLLGGLPVTSVLARGSVNIEAGSRTKAASIMHGLMIGLALFFLGPQLSQLPLASLAAVLVVVGVFLMQLRAVRELLQQGPSQTVPFLVTALGLWLGSLMIGMVMGMFASLLFVLGDLFVSRGFEVVHHGRVLEIKLASEVTFFHRRALSKIFRQARRGDVVHIDGSDSRRISYDVVEAIQEFRKGAPYRGIQVVVGGLPGIPSYSEEHMKEIDNEYHQLISNNKEWVAEKLQENPAYFEEMVHGQSPTFLFVGCSDSRVPAESITKTDPGKLFVHRNIANIVSHADVNLMSVLQYSVEVLKVPHIIICGHYGCGGVKAALGNASLGLIDQWIIPIKTTIALHHEELSQISDARLHERRVIELHVIQQVNNLLKTSILQRSVKHFGRPKVHGWVYDLETGLINDLKVELTAKQDLMPIFQFDFSSGEAERH